MKARKIVLTTAGSHEEAQKIARVLVEQRLAACVNIVSGVESVYRWKDEIEAAQEWMLIIKTTADAFERVRDAIRDLHSYELPECVQLPIETGSELYMQWIDENVQ